MRPPKLTPKRQALHDSGTINMHAEAVHDSAFVGSEFFDPHDLVQVRYEMLRRVSAEGLSITDAVARFGVTRPTFYKAQADFARAGLVGLLPASLVSFAVGLAAAVDWMQAVGTEAIAQGALDAGASGVIAGLAGLVLSAALQRGGRMYATCHRGRCFSRLCGPQCCSQAR